jgi:hypothetical protein
MHTRLTALAVLTAALVSPSTTVAAADKLSMRLSQTVASAPAEVIVTATVERGADNRALEIAAESQDFFRSSLVTLDGDQAPRTTQLRFTNLPSGEYVVVVVLHGSHGERTFERRTFIVMPTVGTR